MLIWNKVAVPNIIWPLQAHINRIINDIFNSYISVTTLNAIRQNYYYKKNKTSNGTTAMTNLIASIVMCSIDICKCTFFGSKTGVDACLELILWIWVLFASFLVLNSNLLQIDFCRFNHLGTNKHWNLHLTFCFILHLENGKIFQDLLCFKA